MRRIPGSFWVCAARIVAEFKRAGSVRQPTRSRCGHLVWSCIWRGAPFGLMLWLIWRCNWLGAAVGSLLRLAWRCGRLGAAAYQPIWHGNLSGVRLAVASIGSARQLVPQRAWQLGSVDLRSRLDKQSRVVDHRRIAIQRKRKVQIVTKVVNSGALEGPFWRNRTL